jgi:hypothetical protein
MDRPLAGLGRVSGQGMLFPIVLALGGIPILVENVATQLPVVSAGSLNDLSRASQNRRRNGEPSAFAVGMLITNSNTVGCSTGRSAGFAPLRILWTWAATRGTFCNGAGP